MTGVAMEMTIEDSAYRAALARIVAANGPGALHSVFDVIGEAMVSKTQMRFHEGHGPDGEAWKPSQRAVKTGGQTLIETGRLMQSQTHNVLPDNEGVEWGTNVVYAAIHQNGGTIDIHAHEQTIFRKVGRDGTLGNLFVRRSKANFESSHHVGDYSIEMPARAFVGIDDDDRAEILDVLVRHEQNAIDGSAH